MDILELQVCYRLLQAMFLRVDKAYISDTLQLVHKDMLKVAHTHAAQRDEVRGANRGMVRSALLS